MDIRRLDRTGWISPLIVRITLFDDSRLLLVYPGDLDTCNSLLRHLRRLSRDALIDGIPYRQYWGEVLAPASERKPQASAASLPHPASRGRGRSRTPLPAAENRRQSRSEEFHGREVVRGCAPLFPVSNPCLRSCCWCSLAVSGARSSGLPRFGRALVHDDGAGKADIAVVLAGDYWGHRLTERRPNWSRQGYVPRVLVSGPPGFYGVNEADVAIHLRHRARDIRRSGSSRCATRRSPPAKRPTSSWTN